ncbi:sensor histidine kinase [Phaeocystidibacter marisrubri]|uniref:Signal transduction histidine kinase internal region domain-containing protein n=1 Tax=Phaeocystidibacter marisrubri TaxID=1577780 RepID=A0A6L3ZG76_9FLAO|nr:histidine kinase [Phaeocystidibacter marisrubri]KAB2816354.1 hypothetical protein F8C82_11765 [Phaeocystidibacter marisrubri]GGH68612.1 hypothetical protein GCM10011318_08810 [Phaeocystidibacter marisrubri]
MNKSTIRFFLAFLFFQLTVVAQCQDSWNELRTGDVYVIKHDNCGRLVVGSDQGLFVYDGYSLRSVLEYRTDVLDVSINEDNQLFPSYFSKNLVIGNSGERVSAPDSVNDRLIHLIGRGFTFGRSLNHIPIFNGFLEDSTYVELSGDGSVVFEYKGYPMPLEHFIASIDLWGGKQLLISTPGQSVFVLDLQSDQKYPLIKLDDVVFRSARQLSDTTLALVKPGVVDSLIYFNFNSNLHITNRRSVGLGSEVINLCQSENGVFVTYRSGGFREYDLKLSPGSLLAEEYLINFVHEFRGHYYLGTRGQGLQVIRNAHHRMETQTVFEPHHFQCLFRVGDRIGYAGLSENRLTLTTAHHDDFQNVQTSEYRYLKPSLSEVYTYQSHLMVDGALFAPEAFVEDVFQSVVGFGVFKSKTIYNGDLWVCLHNGLYRFEEGLDSNRAEEVLSERIYHIDFIDSTRSLMALIDGLYVFNHRTKTRVKLSSLSDRTGAIQDLYIDRKQGYAYIASITGLFRIPTHQLTTTPFNRMEEVVKLERIVDLRTEKIIFREGRLYANHGRSITCLNPVNMRMQHYSELNGLPDKAIKDIEVLKGCMYVAIAGEVYRFTLGESPSLTYRVELAAAEANDRYLDRATSYTFRPDESIIRFFLSNNHWENVDFLNYEFRLLPIRENWTKTDRPELSFYDLAPGSYQLEVRLKNNLENAFSDQNLVVAFVVEPHFWETSVFQWLVVLFWVGLAFSLIYYVNYRVQTRRIQELNHKKEVSDLSFRMIRAQINPHFIFNCLNSILLLNFKKQYEQVGHYILSFSRMIKVNLDISETIYHTIQDEVEYLRNYLELEGLRFKDQLITYIHLDEELDTQTLIPCFFVQIFVENSIKHGRKTNAPLTVDVRFSRVDEQTIEVVIEDDGKGFSNVSSSGMGMGLQLIQDRIRIYKDVYHYRIELTQSEKAIGTYTHLTFKNESR